MGKAELPCRGAWADRKRETFYPNSAKKHVPLHKRTITSFASVAVVSSFAGISDKAPARARLPFLQLFLL